MHTRSDQYKELMKKPLRERSFMQVDIGVINQQAQATSYVDNTADALYLSTFDLFSKRNIINYATFEQDFTKADGELFFPPRQGADFSTGFISNGLLASGNQFVLIKPGVELVDVKGLMITFGKNYPIDFTIETNVETVNVVNNTTQFYKTNNVFDGATYFKITATRMKNPNMRLKIQDITFGIGIHFDNSNIKSASLKSYVSLISDDLPQLDFDVKVDNITKEYSLENSESTINFIEAGQGVIIQTGLELTDGTIEWFKNATLKIKSWDADDEVATFRSSDLLDTQDTNFYKGKYYQAGISLYDLAVLVFTDMGFTSEQYRIDEYLKTVFTHNPIPKVKHKQALQLIANCGRCTLFIDSDAKIILKSNFIPTATITSNDNNLVSTVENILTLAEIKKYAFFDENYTKANGEYYFAPRNTQVEDTLYVSEQVSHMPVKQEEKSGTVIKSPEILRDSTASITKIEGASSQVVTTVGKNKLDPLLAPNILRLGGTENGLTCVVNSNGTITVSGTATANTTWMYQDISKYLVNGTTYNVSSSLAGVNAGTRITDMVDVNSYASTFVYNSNTMKSVRPYFQVPTIGAVINGILKPQFEVGAVSTAFENFIPNSPSPEYPATFTIPSNFDLGVSSENKNLLKLSGRVIKTTTYAMADYFFSTPPIDGNTYTVTLKGSLGYDRDWFAIYNSGGSVELTRLHLDADGLYRSTFVWRKSVSSNTYLRVYQIQQTDLYASTIEWIKLEEGELSTPWVPAIDDVGYGVLTNGVYKAVKVTQELRALPNGVKDTIEVVNGVLNHVQRVGKVVFDGSADENWITENPLTKTLLFYISGYGKSSGGTVLCDRFPPGGDYYNSDIQSVWNKYSLIEIRINKNFLTTQDVAGFKTWLSTNNLTVLYELANPVYTPLANILLNTYKGFNNVISNATPQINLTANFNDVIDTSFGDIGLFDTNPSLEIQMESVYDMVGLALTFDGYLPSSFKVDAYKYNELLSTKTVNDISEITKVTDEFLGFDKIILTFLGMSKSNTRLRIQSIKLGDVTDYNIDYSDLLKTPKGIQLEKVQSVVVLRNDFIQSDDAQSKQISKTILTANSSNNIFEVQWNNPAYNIAASVAGYGVTILDSGAYYAKCQITGLPVGNTQVTLVITGKEFVMSSAMLQKVINTQGFTKTLNNPLVDNNTVANNLCDWLGDYYSSDREYSIEYRGDSAFEANDYFFLENEFNSALLCRAYSHNLDFDGSIKGSISARRVVDV